MKIINSEYRDLHTSRDKDTRWFVDTFDLNDDKYTIHGWVLNYNKKISSITIGTKRYDWDEVSVFRPDVEKIYSEGANSKIGFIIELDDKRLDREVDVKFEGDKGDTYLGNISSFTGEETVSKKEPKKKVSSDVGGLTPFSKRELIIVDNFYTDPDKVREYAINNMEFIGNSDFYRGNRTQETFTVDGTKERFEYLLDKEIVHWDDGTYQNGMFQWCPGDTPIVYHVDEQQYAAIIFLTPNAPLNTGTKTYRSKITGATHYSGSQISLDNPEYVKTFSGYGNEPSFYESVSFEEVDSVANVYNRLVIWNASSIHAASNYFGNTINNSRLFQLFFFDVK